MDSARARVGGDFLAEVNAFGATMEPKDVYPRIRTARQDCGGQVLDVALNREARKAMAAEARRYVFVWSSDVDNDYKYPRGVKGVAQPDTCVKV